MGQIIAFPVQPTPYPDHTEDLGTADCVLLLAIRWWVEDYRASTDPMPRLRSALQDAGAHDAAFPIDGLMTTIARVARRPVDIHCPRCPHVSDAEKQLLHAASLVQACNAPLAEKALRTALLSAEGAEFALAALEGLGTLFAQARLFFTRRAAPALELDSSLEADSPLLSDIDDMREAWTPPPVLH
jgi:hypothetical protein